MATKTMKCLLRLSLFTHRNLPIQLVRSHRRSCSNKSDDSVRIVFISDTHSYHHQLPSLPHGDILIHAGMIHLLYCFYICLLSVLLHFPNLLQEISQSGGHREQRNTRTSWTGTAVSLTSIKCSSVAIGTTSWTQIPQKRQTGVFC